MRSFSGLAFLCSGLLCACSGNRPRGGDDDDEAVQGDADADVDSDADGDTDADTDGDGDADGDSDGDADVCSVPDRDGDGHAAQLCQGDDCDDGDDAVHPGASDDATWALDPVADGAEPAVAVDANGAVHVVFSWVLNGEYSLGYGTNASGRWEAAEIVQADIAWPSIAVDGGGAVHISHFDGIRGSRDIQYVTNASGEWSTRVLGEGFRSSIAVDSSGHVFVALSRIIQDELFELVVASDESGVWQTISIDDTPSRGGHSPRIVTDREDFLHVAYVADWELIYATNAGGEWTVASLSSVGGAEVAIAVDATGGAYIATEVEGTGLSIVTNATGDWETDRVDADGMVPALVVDESGASHVLYTDLEISTVRYASNASGLWRTEDIGDSIYPGGLAIFGGTMHGAWNDGITVVHAERSVPDEVDQDCDGFGW